MADSKQPKYRNTGKADIHLNYFQGGATFTDPKLGIANSFYSSTAMDSRSLPSQISVLPGMSDVSGGVVTDLITAMDQDLNGVRYGVGDQGNVYRISTSNVFSKIATMGSGGSAGILYNQITDQLYIPSQDTISLYGRVTTVDGTDPQWRLDQFAQSFSSSPGVVQLFVQTGGNAGFWQGLERNNAETIGQAQAITETSQITSLATGTFAVPTVLSETISTLCQFVPDIEPGYSIAVNITTVGTGNYTLTLHDTLNNVLASVTIPNASMVVGYNEFVFGSQIRMIVQQTQTGASAVYHWHLTSTVNDGVVAVIPDTNGGADTGNGTGDMESADFLWSAYRLVATANGWHPMVNFNSNLLCIGNGQYLSTYDFTQDSGPPNTAWNRHTLIFPNGYEVCGLSTNNQYLVVALEKRSTNSSRNAQDGKLVFWDQTTASPNFVIDIPMGSPYGLQTFNNVTYFVCAGSLFAWSGGQTVIKVRKLAYQQTDYLGVVDSTIVNPNMLAIRYNLLLIGYPSKTTNVNLKYGVYTWGSIEVTFPNSMAYSYQLSNRLSNNAPATNLQIGCVYNFVDQMYTPWSYTDAGGNNHYGVDFLSNSSTPAPYFDFRTLIYDGGISYKKKQGLRMQLTFLPLPSGYTLQAFYSIDRGADVLSPTASTGDSKLVFELDNARNHELQWGFIGTTSGATNPADFTGVTMEVAPLEEETGITPYNN